MLKPCPFCGGDRTDYRFKSKKDVCTIQVACQWCGATGPRVPVGITDGAGFADARAKWNERVSDTIASLAA